MSNLFSYRVLRIEYRVKKKNKKDWKNKSNNYSFLS